MSFTKMTFKVQKGLWGRFRRQIGSMPIQLDAFLDSILATETQRLIESVEEKPKLSNDAKRYVAGELKWLETQPVSVVVRKETADKLSEIVKTKNLVRDAFFNRMILFLWSSDGLLESIGIPKQSDKALRGTGFAALPTSPMSALAEAFDDPMAILHGYCESQLEQPLYLLHLPTALVGFSCWIDDEEVPNTEAYEKNQRDLQELIEAFSGIEASLPPKQKES